MNKIFKLQFACGLGWILIRIEISNKSSTEAFFVVDNSNFKAGLSINSPWLTFLSPLSPKKTGCIKNLDQHHPGMRVGARSKPNSSFSVWEISRLTWIGSSAIVHAYQTFVQPENICNILTADLFTSFGKGTTRNLFGTFSELDKVNCANSFYLNIPFVCQKSFWLSPFRMR